MADLLKIVLLCHVIFIHNKLFCEGSHIVIKNRFILYMFVANHGSEEIYLCNVVEKIHQYFRPTMRQMFQRMKSVVV
jgi:hypothetical protein